MKKLLIIVMLIGVLLLSGCSYTTTITETQINTEIITTTKYSNTPIPDELYDISWVSPAKVEVGNFHSGARAEHPLTIHNGYDVAKYYNITTRLADNTLEEYVDAPTNYKDWVIIENESILLLPKETKEVLVSIQLPKDIKINDKKWEFWVVMAESNPGMVTTEMACRWLITMR